MNKTPKTASLPVRKELNHDGKRIIYHACPSNWIPSSVIDFFNRFSYEKEFNQMPKYDVISNKYLEMIGAYESYYREYMELIRLRNDLKRA